MNKDKLERETDHISALQSWGPELRFFESLPERPIDAGICDVIIDKPTVFMKIDASKSTKYNITFNFF